MTYAKQKTQLKLVISIGANIPGILGDPIRTIATMRPQIEKSIIEFLRLHSIRAYPDRKKIGIWVKGNKIAAIGLRISRWIAYHG